VTATITMMSLLVGAVLISLFAWCSRAPCCSTDSSWPMGSYLLKLALRDHATALLFAGYSSNAPWWAGVLLLASRACWAVRVDSATACSPLLRHRAAVAVALRAVAFDRDSGIAPSGHQVLRAWAIASGALLYGSPSFTVSPAAHLDRLTSVRQGASEGVIVAIAFIVAAIAFKFGAVPFHMWCPMSTRGRRPADDVHRHGFELGSFALIARLLSHAWPACPHLDADVMAVLCCRCCSAT